jgi:hypothetical protein
MNTSVASLPGASLSMVAARGRPVTMADTRLMEVPYAMVGLFPEGGIRRGSTVAVDPASGGLSLALSLAAEVTGDGSWVAVVGLPSLGVVAAAELGVRLDRLALVHHPGDQWPAVVASLLDGVDLLLLRTPTRARAADARRLAARARERGTVMMVLDRDGSGRAGQRWPESPDLRLAVVRSVWGGLGEGYGHLEARQMEVVLTGRRAAARERRQSLWLPGPGGKPEAVPETGEWGGSWKAEEGAERRASAEWSAEWDGQESAPEAGQAAEMVG